MRVQSGWNSNPSSQAHPNRHIVRMRPFRLAGSHTPRRERGRPVEQPGTRCDSVRRSTPRRRLPVPLGLVHRPGDRRVGSRPATSSASPTEPAVRRFLQLTTTAPGEEHPQRDSNPCYRRERANEGAPDKDESQ
jgi:hypothetical protein